VDNASTDGSLELLARDYSKVRVLALPSNQGFTGACNAGHSSEPRRICRPAQQRYGSRCALAGRGRRHIRASPRGGSRRQQMLLFDQRDTLHNAGDFYRLRRRARAIAVYGSATKGSSTAKSMSFPRAAGSAAYRRSMLGEVGLLDDDFFFSCEDIDLAWRAQLAGWKCVFAPKAIVYHKLAATAAGRRRAFTTGAMPSGWSPRIIQARCGSATGEPSSRPNYASRAKPCGRGADRPPVRACARSNLPAARLAQNASQAASHPGLPPHFG